MIPAIGLMNTPRISSNVDLLNGLFGLWEFNETSGSIAYDETGNYDGENVSVSVNQSGIVGSGTSYYFSSSWARVDINNYIYLPDISVSMWIYPQTTAEAFFFDCGLAIVPYLAFSINTGANQVGFRHNVNGLGVEYLWYSTGTLSTDTWYHVVGVLTSTEQILYVNGIERAHTYTTITGSNRSATAPYFGARSRLSSYDFVGRMDQSGIWTRGLTPTEVTYLYNSGAGLPYSSF